MGLLADAADVSRSLRFDWLQSFLPHLFTLTGTAYVYGLKHATGDFVIVMDADLSHHVRS